MQVLQPSGLDEALQMKSECPEAVPLAGGTDLMVELNFDKRRPQAILDLTRVDALRRWERADGAIRLGSGVTYTRVITELPDDLPGLAMASRTVGSPQIRNRGTIGGNLGTASPAGDALPPLLAADATIEVASTRGTRPIPIGQFVTGPKRNALESDELVTVVVVPVATGPQQFSKIGTRNAMVIAVAAFALALDPAKRRVGTGIGSAGPTPLRAHDAERFLAETLEDEDGWEARPPLGESVARHFGELVAASAQPIDDVRGTAAYRRRALEVMARRTLSWAWHQRLESS